MPRPWISRTSRKPRACAARGDSAPTEGTSRGRKECRSSASSIGRRTGSSSLRLQAGAAHHVLLPVLVAQEILPCKLALSERGGALAEGHVDHADALGARALGHLLRHHLANERARDPSAPTQDFLAAAHPRP